MTYDEWEEKYKPIKNHLVEDASHNGTLFETYGKELQFIYAQRDTGKVWTLIEGEEDDNHYILSGYHWCNRLGYFLTEEPELKHMEILDDM